ncbi:MAG: family 78 glycoside hydrolase catalytic domain [Fimbriimonadaceae bacterium]|nr:family 78 glycoside hydrolase catalytic domain [Fimbriimonadaceae bacterium]
MLLSLALAALSPVDAAALSPDRLRCEYLENPVAIGTVTPRFTWELRDPRQGARQTAYQIIVASERSKADKGEGDCWDTGQVAGDQTVLIRYAGQLLRHGSQYFWRVRTWDQDGKRSAWSRVAQFGVGLSRSQWKAQWVEDPVPVQQFAPARNGYHSQMAGKPDIEKWVEIDLGSATEFDRVVLYPSRPVDWVRDAPGFLFPVRFQILADGQVVHDQTATDLANPGDNPYAIRLSKPVSARTIRLRVTKLAEREANAFGVTLAEFDAFLGDKRVSAGRAVKASDSIENAVWSVRFLTDGTMKSRKASGTDALPSPTMRKEFSVAKKVKRAVLSVACLGLYDLKLNGKSFENLTLSPDWTDYHERVLAQAYDVTSHLTEGKNAIGVELGDGWYAGRLGMAQGLTADGRPRAVYGRNPKLKVQLDIEYTDGSSDQIITDSTWRSTLNGPIRSADLLDGVHVDLRKSLGDYSKAGYNDKSWSAAQVVEGKAVNDVQVLWQPNEPIAIVERLKAKSITEHKPGVIVVDMGQNMPGWIRFLADGKAGDEVVVQYAEMLNEDGTVYTANLRGAPQRDRFILAKDGPVWLEPKFIYHGFRYVQITGLSPSPRTAGVPAGPSPSQESPASDAGGDASGTEAVRDVEGIVFCSSAEDVGTFACSDPMLTRLWQNIHWTQRANLMSVPTDCPQRDERLGWMGDILIFAPTACYQMDLGGFYTKWFADVRDAQADDGRLPDFAPHPYDKNRHFTGVPGWGDAGVFVPWTAYQFYGDTQILVDHFDASRRWVDWILSKNPDLIWKNNRHNDYNDWVNGDSLIQEGWPRTGATIPNEAFATIYFYASTCIVRDMAKVIGKTEEAKQYGELADRIKATFQKEFVSADGTVKGNTQAGYALALSFGLIPENLRGAALNKMVAAVDAYKGHMSTGFHSSHRLMLELANADRNDLAYTLALNRTFPSWGYSIENGATTIWERWDGYVKGRGFQDPGMNSFNHWAFGAVGEWMMETVLGIKRDPTAVGWKKIIVAPVVDPRVTWAKGSYHSIRGKISVDWKTENGKLSMTMTVPPNVEATLVVPTKRPASVKVDGKAFGKGQIEVVGGTYQIEADL